jgi:ribosomal protein L37AE/L43A
MDSVRKGIRSGAIEKDTYERLTCASCGEPLKSKEGDDALGGIRFCPDCDREWKKLS